jgi:hypothetical protein
MYLWELVGSQGLSLVEADAKLDGFRQAVGFDQKQDAIVPAGHSSSLKGKGRQDECEQTSKQGRRLRGFATTRITS